MGFLFNQILKKCIVLADKENFGDDIAEYVYEKFGTKVAEKLIALLIDESTCARKKLDEIKAKDEKTSNKKTKRIRNPKRDL